MYSILKYDFFFSIWIQTAQRFCFLNKKFSGGTCLLSVSRKIRKGVYSFTAPFVLACSIFAHYEHYSWLAMLEGNFLLLLYFLPFCYFCLLRLSVLRSFRSSLTLDGIVISGLGSNCWLLTCSDNMVIESYILLNGEYVSFRLISVFW